MKTCLFILIALLEVSYARDKGIYGDDNRRAIYDSTSSEQKLAQSVLAQVPFYKMASSDNASITFDVKSVRNSLNMCAEEKFSDEMMLSSCTGFLVAPDLLLTAGHCIKDKTDCLKNMWILDYDKSQSVFSKDKIVYCKEIVDSNFASDYSLIRLSKKITDRVPLKIRRSGKLNPEAEFIVIGHPLGLPKVSTDQAFLRGNLLNKIFTINSDTYSGNSGSPVIDSKTSLVEGILIKGDKDFEMDFVSLCQRSVHCEEKSCIGETVLRATAIPTSILQ
jgi:hypothetical protein